ncbi:MAG: DUF4838 domain-containing protein [Pirellulaceae bacterium]
MESCPTQAVLPWVGLAAEKVIRDRYTLLLLFTLLMSSTALGQRFLVKNGQPRAEIVIADDPPRATRLAAREFRDGVERISGADLSIVTTPNPQVPVKVYVGQSTHTEKRNITADGLEHGAYRIVSGDNWMVLIGDDTDFRPIEPWPRSNSDWVSGRVHAEWHRITESNWGNPLSQLRKHYTGRATTFGTRDHESVAEDGTVHVWGFDERGSFNAVCGFLRKLGVRWYMPGDVGEVVPSLASIPLPEIDETIRPDFPVRSFNIRFGVHGPETARWAMRLGIRNPYGLQTAHGLHHMTHNEHTLKTHPDWFARYGGKRDNQLGQRLNQLCYSNEELLHETARFVRAQFDHYQFDVVSVMPPDGYTAICQCELCEGKDTPERGYRGGLSDYVWNFVNRVAKEVRKTHPDKMISNCAYGTYTLPPRTIDRLEPNVQVIIVGGRRPTDSQRDEVRELRKAWLAKTDNPIMIFENYPFTDRGFYLPAYMPRVLGESINATKGISRGEDIWLSVRQDFHENDIGFNHFLVYFTARMYWGGKQQNVAALFEEYCHLFYGPAAEAMQAFFEYCEAHWREMEEDESKANRALELFAAAQAEVDKGSIHAKRLEFIDAYLDGLRQKREQLAQKRGPVPRLRLVGNPRDEIVVDGKLDDKAWRECPVASTGHLRELQTGRQPIFGTTFKTAWRGGNLYFAIRCEEREDAKLNIATTRREDQAIWYGDVVEILLDTESHSYYQLAINPSGAFIDLDRGVPKNRWFDWDSRAEIATRVADDHWTVEIRIPVVEDENDPLHQVIGRKPTQSLPWHINICRQRIRENGSEYSAFAPTGTPSFHVPLKFAHFYKGRSHQFEADPTVTDYLIDSRAARELARDREFEEALAAFVTLANREGVTEYQRSIALQQAARCARDLKDYERARALAGRIPIPAVADTVRMQNLLAQREWHELIERFGAEDLARWPFWQAGEAYFARGRAYIHAGAGEKAESDLLAALELTPDDRLRTSILLNLGRNRETVLEDNTMALEAYQRIADQRKNTGSADYFRGVQGAARILALRGEFDAAMNTLDRVNVEDLRGYWRGSMLLSRGAALTAAGRTDEALKTYGAMLTDACVEPVHRRKAKKRINQEHPDQGSENE